MRKHTVAGAFILLALLVTACGPLGWGGSPYGRYASNGERIYFTGASANGPIRYSGGVSVGMMGGGMMGGGQLACADCHGSGGRGGRHVMHMTVMDAPDIRWSTLSEAEHDDEEMDHPPYDAESFNRAVTQGLEPDGKRLDPAMPRWQMSDKDLDGLLEFLKSLK